MPSTILCKPTRLSDEEIAIVREQPRLVSQLLDHHPFLGPAAAMTRAIFERFDGTGYPWALRGDEIPLGARVIAVADALDAMTHYRLHQDARTPAEAIFEIQRGCGTQFDPAAVEALLKVVHLHWASMTRRPGADPEDSSPATT
jgi:HD-GYP domain-containing protein (c-di-GMP phosphodiesterase class II)